MSDYTQITDFSAKDALASGDPEKIATGADVDAELAAISTAIATKLDAAGDTLTGTLSGGILSPTTLNVPSDTSLTSPTIAGTPVLTGTSSSLKPLVKDHGTQAGNYTLQLDEAELHLVDFSALATLTIASANTNDKATVVVKNGGNVITLAGIDNDSPTLTNAITTQDFIGLVKSFGKITAVAVLLNKATV